MKKKIWHIHLIRVYHSVFDANLNANSVDFTATDLFYFFIIMYKHICSCNICSGRMSISICVLLFGFLSEMLPKGRRKTCGTAALLENVSKQVRLYGAVPALKKAASQLFDSVCKFSLLQTAPEQPEQL